MCNPGRKIINCLIELAHEREVGDCGWEVVNVLVEVRSESEVGELGRKSIYGFVERARY